MLENLSLPNSSIALIYSLGHEKELIDDDYREVFGDKDIKSVFEDWSNQPASEELPDKPALYDESKVQLKSNLLGCEVEIESENNSPCLELAESLLSALESLLSTAISKHMAAREPRLLITVRKSDFAKKPFEYDVQDNDGIPNIIITGSFFDPHSMSIEKQGEIKENLLNLITTIIARIIVISDPDKDLPELFYKEQGLERSISFTGSFVTLGNVLGYTPKFSLANWVNLEFHEYPLIRSEMWNADILRKKEEDKTRLNKPSIAPRGETPPPELLDPENTKHSQIKTVSLIRESLWDKAEWFGVGVLISMDSSAPPVLAPTFKDPTVAKQIFTYWINELGNKDEQERLRISIIRGIRKKNPYHYRVVIGSNPITSLQSSKVRLAILINRTHTMEPSSNENIERFLQSYKAFGQYFLAPATATKDMKSITPMLDYYIAKKEIYVKDAWEIGINDVEGTAIYESDDPIIPKDITNPPVFELLRAKGKRISPKRKRSR